MHLLRVGFVLVTVLFAGRGVASAQGSLDLVQLSNGGFVRGTVLEYEPGQSIVVQLPNGTTRTIPAGEVARVQVGGALPVTPPTPPPVAAVAAPEDDSARRLIAAPPTDDGPWRLDDRRGGQEAWPDLVERNAYRPRGLVRFGVAGGLGLIASSSGGDLFGETGFAAEVGAVLDLRPDELSPYRLRVEAVVGGLGHGGRWSSGLGWRVPLFIRLFPLGLDLGDWFVWRLGVDLGWYAGNIGQSGVDVRGFYVGPVTELAATLADRQLEIGFLIGSPTALHPLWQRTGLQMMLRVSYLF